MCGIVGIYGSPDAATLAASCLHALQHRGQESAGIISYDATIDNGHLPGFHERGEPGLVGENFTDPPVIARLSGSMAIGHNRYSTSGEKTDPVKRRRNIQPLLVELPCGGVAIAHNGNLVDARSHRGRLISEEKRIFSTTTDTEVIAHLMAISGSGAVNRLTAALEQVQGAYSLVVLTKDELIGVRDPHGFRPLVLGRKGNGWILVSETCALDIIDAEFVRDILPGEIIVINANGVASYFPFAEQPSNFCVFEYVYFARPDSEWEGISNDIARERMGARLAQESPVEADIVVPVQGSGSPAAVGYHEQSGIPLKLALVRNHYVGRTFIEPTEEIRLLGVRLKHNPIKALVAGKRIVLIDDSIVRANTSKKLVQLLRQAGAAEIHLRVASPPIKCPCFYGIDTPRKEELLANNMSVEEMRRHIGADSLAFLSLHGMYQAVAGIDRDDRCPQYCDACFTGDYPVAIKDIPL